ncbi:hypothetical protein CIW52_04080 [Mycolicibacterium sp. P9-64]|uniref:DUF6636 domain-containing protein n=1 Tax=Mycolicibacterium sp. P9-64 TaxID=2024612 RepID=UPI0011EC73F1|nr:DUF6636 domain-containing protein [Mycolicibacterium sp. P9-64]KAA0087048.1 hypothetical protein CIW52_04080 [Mycolicibacterium sp. P9-64]
MTARRPRIWVIGLGALALAACAPSTGASTAPSPTLIPVISMSTPTPTPAAPTTTVTVTAPPPVTVTAAPTPATIPVGQQITSDEPFQSPSGNISCAMFTYGAGGHTVRCEVAAHDWVATQPDGCQMNWGDRVALEEGSAAVFGCYGQVMPAPTHTLAYGHIQTLGSLRCTSETVGITCVDTNTFHYFSVSRDTVQLG